MTNPQAYQEFQQARKNNEDPNQFLNKTITTNIYTNSNKYIFSVFNSIYSRIITFSLKDYYYNIPIEKGEIILWQK